MPSGKIDLYGRPGGDTSLGTPEPSALEGGVDQTANTVEAEGGTSSAAGTETTEVQAAVNSALACVVGNTDPEVRSMTYGYDLFGGYSERSKSH